MADPELAKLLRQGSEAWNSWRVQEPEDLYIDLSQVDLSYTNLSHTNLSYANLNGANLNVAQVGDANLSHARLNNASLSHAQMNGINLSYADLKYANLSRASLSGAYLNHADLSHADLSHINLNAAHLHCANLNYANLSNTDLSEANLSSADLKSADLSYTHLNGVNLSQANLSDARIYHTVFANTDFRATKGLIEIVHRGPSVVALNTVLLPSDGSALHFLRGAGVPDEWIDDYRARMMNPIQYHSCFISYSSQDHILSRRLYADLQAHGVCCWFAPEDMKIGEKIRQRIDEAIHLHEKLLLLLSEHSLASNWVEDEVEAALEKEQHQQREVLFPIRLDNAVMETHQVWAAKLRRQRHIGDFTNWARPQKYEQAFERLLRDLKKADE